jgi:hypothetical protein
MADEIKTIDEIKVIDTVKPIKEKYYVSGFKTIFKDPMYYIAITSLNSLKKIEKFLFNISATSHIEFRIYENAEINGGKKIHIFNHDRNNEVFSILNIVDEPGIVSLGDCIYSVSKGKAGYEIPLEITNNLNTKFILKNDITYLIAISTKTDQNIVSYLFNWEETNNLTETL